MNRAELSEWYCEHKQTHCGGPSSSRLEDAWNQRERGYQLALGLVAAAGGLLTIVAHRRRLGGDLTAMLLSRLERADAHHFLVLRVVPAAARDRLRSLDAVCGLGAAVSVSRPHMGCRTQLETSL